MGATDVRKWAATDRPGEWLAVGRPLPGVEIMSVRGSTRLWREQLHEDFTLAAVCRTQPVILAEWRTRCRSFSTKNGELMAINAGDGHVTDRVNAPAAFDVVHLSPPLLEEAIRSLDVRGGFRFRAPVCTDSAIFESVQLLVQGVARGADSLELGSLTADIVWNLATRFAEASPAVGVTLHPVRDYRLRRLRDVLEESLRSTPVQKPSLDELARGVGLSVFRTCAIFKQTYGVSIGTYWTACRITRATHLLLRGIPIRVVAARLGFSDESEFNRVFKRHRGLPPAQWRALHRGNSEPDATPCVVLEPPLTRTPEAFPAQDPGPRK